MRIYCYLRFHWFHDFSLLPFVAALEVFVRFEVSRTTRRIIPEDTILLGSVCLCMTDSTLALPSAVAVIPDNDFREDVCVVTWGTVLFCAAVFVPCNALNIGLNVFVFFICRPSLLILYM
jgi:hypothetical protein